MRPIVSILLGGMLVAAAVTASSPAAAAPEPESRKTVLSNELGAFVEKAVNEGLLDPVGKAKPQSVEEGAPTQLVAPSAEIAHSGLIDCSAPYPLDFNEFESLTRYSDVYNYRDPAPEDGGVQATGQGASGARLAKVYVALDLASEAAMTVKSARDQDSVAVYNLAMLLEGQAAGSAAYFSELAACFPRARIWQSLALLAQQDARGADLLEAEMPSFRQLPLHLRDRAALIAIPELDAIGQQTLAKTLLAAFSEEEIANSSQLRFSQALLELGAGNADAEEQIAQFLIQSRFQEPALSALIRHKRPVSDAMRHILYDDMVNRLEEAQQDADVRDDLKFVLDEMSASSMYVPMLKLAELPSMQTPSAREELSTHLAASLQRDLASEDVLRNLAAIEALIKDPGLLETAPDRAALYETATAVAVRLGFGELGDKLSDKAQESEGVAEQRAVLAFRQKKIDEVFDLASRFPRNQKINLIAAKAAIDTRDRAKLAVIEARLELVPDTILALIEQDAATGHWLVSPAVFEAAGKLTDAGHQDRVKRVNRLKTAGSEPVPTGRVAMTSISGKLSQSRASLQQLSAQAAAEETTAGETP